MLAPGNLIDADIDQSGEAVGVEFLSLSRILCKSEMGLLRIVF